MEVTAGLKNDLEARVGIEPTNDGFADFGDRAGSLV